MEHESGKTIILIRELAKVLFSGIEFNVEPRLGLKGVCDFLMSKSEEQYVLRAPVIVIVEAKKGEIEVGMGQCTAEMIAAQKFFSFPNSIWETK